VLFTEQCCRFVFLGSVMLRLRLTPASSDFPCRTATVLNVLLMYCRPHPVPILSSCHHSSCYIQGMDKYASTVVLVIQSRMCPVTQTQGASSKQTRRQTHTPPRTILRLCALSFVRPQTTCPAPLLHGPTMTS
jgi:hypothetical protein